MTDEFPSSLSASDSYARGMDGNGFFTQRQAFPETRWSLVAAAGVDDATGTSAMAELCQAYWIPIYGFIRRSGKSREDAEDLTQGFFLRVIDHEIMTQARRDRGKLRSFLLGALKRFLCDDYDRESALKRGGKFTFVSFDYEEAENAFEQTCHKAVDPAKQYDRQWALTLLADVLDSLRKEYEDNGRSALFATLYPVLTQQSLDQPYQSIGETLSLSANAVKIAIYRLRQRYREMLCARIADTVGSAEEMQSEITYLCDLFGHQETTITHKTCQPSKI